MEETSSTSPSVGGAAPAPVSKRDERMARMERAIRRRRIKIWGSIVALAVIVVVLLGWSIVSYNRRAAEVPGVSYPDAGQDHIALSAQLPRPYTSNPPSSGAHFASPANWGVYDYEVNDKIFIHNIEHGGIWIAYHPRIPKEVVVQLEEIVRDLGGSKLVMAPRSVNDRDIAVVAWGKVYAFDLENNALTDARKDEIRTFYRYLKNRGPEFVPDNMPGIDPKSVQK